MKTPLLAPIQDGLATLNDQLCFFLFAENELVRRLDDFSPKVAELYTTDVFGKNPYARTIHIRIEELKEFQVRNRTFTFGAYFSTSYEVFQDFYDRATQLLSEINSRTFVEVKDNRKEWAYLQTLIASSCAQPDQEIIDTLTYIRMRRNHFIHRNPSLADGIECIIKDKGLSLNNYWAEARQYLDFTNPDIAVFHEVETIDLMKLLRIIVIRLDENLSGNLLTDNIIKRIASEQLNGKSKPSTVADAERLSRKVKTLANMYYGRSCTIEEVLTVVNTLP